MYASLSFFINLFYKLGTVYICLLRDCKCHSVAKMMKFPLLSSKSNLPLFQSLNFLCQQKLIDDSENNTEFSLEFYFPVVMEAAEKVDQWTSGNRDRKVHKKSMESSKCTSPKHPVSCIKPGLAIHFTYDNLHVSMPFFHIIPPSPSPTESKRLFYKSVSLAVSHTGLSLPSF